MTQCTTQFENETVLIIGSGPNAVDCVDWAGFDRIVAINNAWRIRADWDDLIHPEDFPKARRPKTVAASQRIIEADHFVPAQNAYGGFVYAGATMAFTAGYWALHALRPRIMAFIGCDMVYPATGQTHFYGTGAPDPLRDDISLLDLGASSARMALMAAAQGCRCVNMSRGDSTLMFERATPEKLAELAPSLDPVGPAYRAAVEMEEKLGYFVPSGRIWEHSGQFDPAAMRRVHSLWRRAHADTRGRCVAA